MNWLDKVAAENDTAILFETSVPNFKIAILRTGHDLSAVVTSLPKVDKVKRQAGTWALPDTLKGLVKLHDILERLDSGQLFDVCDEMYDVFGDDEAYDELDAHLTDKDVPLSEKDAKTCASIIRSRLKDLFDEMLIEPETFDPPMYLERKDPKYVQLFQDIINKSSSKMITAQDLQVELLDNDTIVDYVGNTISLETLAELALQRTISEL